MENELTEVIQCAEWLEHLTIRSSIGKISKRFALIESSLNLRRLHARVQELEGMLDSVGAGGASAQRITQADALDAARYRYLRDVDWRYSGELEAVIRLQANALWDVKIDEAIAAQTRSQGESA